MEQGWCGALGAAPRRVAGCPRLRAIRLWQQRRDCQDDHQPRRRSKPAAATRHRLLPKVKKRVRRARALKGRHDPAPPCDAAQGKADYPSHGLRLPRRRLTALVPTCSSLVTLSVWLCWAMIDSPRHRGGNVASRQVRHPCGVTPSCRRRHAVWIISHAQGCGAQRADWSRRAECGSSNWREVPTCDVCVKSSAMAWLCRVTLVCSPARSVFGRLPLAG